MPDVPRTWSHFGRVIRRFPADLFVVLLLTGLACLIFMSGTHETLLRYLVGLLFTLFLPGYAFIAVLFPAGEGAPRKKSSDLDSWHMSGLNQCIDWQERVILSFGLSIVISPLIGITLGFTPWGYQLVPIVLLISIFTIVCVWLAASRRLALPAEQRFQIPYYEWYRTAKTSLTEYNSRTDFILNILLAVTVLLAVTSLGYAVMTPNTSEQYTRFALMTENSSSEFIAGDYPNELTRGESASLIIDVGNFEQQPMNYTVVIQLQRVTNDYQVQERHELDRFHANVNPGQTWRREHEISSPLVGSNLRLQYLLYQDAVPARPDRENAYRDTHFWINVTRSTPSR